MYTAGTISGTKGSNKITGKSTQWLSNLYNILEGQVIVIYTPTSSNAYSIKNIKSNTEIELSKPLYDAFTNATYEIFTTIDNTTSDAAVKIATSIARNNEFMGLMNQWTTGTGTVTVNWGGEQIKLTTVDQMNKNIDKKFDKTGGEITGAITSPALVLKRSGNPLFLNNYPSEDNKSLAYFQYNEGSNWFGRVSIPKVPLSTVETLATEEWVTPGVVFSKTLSLLATDLNTLKGGSSAGLYYQNTSNNALISRNYPIQEAGELTIASSRANNSSVSQTYNTHSSNKSFRRVWSGEGGFWTKWEEISSISDVLSLAFNKKQISPPGGVDDVPWNADSGIYVLKHSSDNKCVVNFSMPTGGGSCPTLQLRGDYSNGGLFYRTAVDTVGFKEAWAKVYTDQNKPTPNEIGTYPAQQIDDKVSGRIAIGKGGANTAFDYAEGKHGYFSWFEGKARTAILGFPSDSNNNILDLLNEKTGGIIRVSTDGSSSRIILSSPAIEVNGGTTVTGNFNTVGLIQVRSNDSAKYIELDAGPSGTGGALPTIKVKKPGLGWTTHAFSDISGTLMQVGDFGWGGSVENNWNTTESTTASRFQLLSTPTQVWRNTPTTKYSTGYSASAYIKCGDCWFNLSVGYGTGVLTITSGNEGTEKVSTVYSTINTTKDSNGNIKAASPIVEIYADHVVLNEESEGVELKKLHTGIYQLKGTLGMNSDPSWGGIHGGIVVPHDINGLQLVYADYDVLAVGQRHPFNGEIVPPEENGDIVVYTTYRKHSDLPQNIQRARLKTYPEFTKEVDGKIVELSAGDFVDIPNGHWLDVRVQMQSNSVYNIRQAEQEELARIAAEKAEAEEVERLEREAIEEAERIEREEIERLEREEADRVAEEAERESYESNDGDQEL